MWETWVRSLDWEDPLEKEKATHSSILAWEVHGVAKSQTRLSYFHFTSCLRKWGSHPPVKEKHGHTSAQRSTSLLLPRGLCHTWCNGIGFKLIFRNVWIRKNLTSHSTGEQWSLSWEFKFNCICLFWVWSPFSLEDGPKIPVYLFLLIPLSTVFCQSRFRQICKPVIPVIWNNSWSLLFWRKSYGQFSSGSDQIIDYI